MDLRPIRDNQKGPYNKLVSHVTQSWEWGEFRKDSGLPLLRYGLYEHGKLTKAFQLTLHKMPFTSQFVGYLPKGPALDQNFVEALQRIGEGTNCAFIKVEPDVEIRDTRYEIPKEFTKSPKPLFTKYNFILDLTKSEEELLKNMHPKTRYNIKLAQKKGVRVEERTDDAAFEIYLKLYFETTRRQGYFGHNENYHRKAWQTLKRAGMARLLIAFYHSPITNHPASPAGGQSLPLTAWMLLNFKDALYYPYGGSSDKYRELMASNLVAWEAIKLGKKMGLKKFDLWGGLGPDADPKDPWYGFHRFKQGYGGKLVEYIGTFDLVFNWPLYLIFTNIDKFTKLKVILLKMLKK